MLQRKDITNLDELKNLLSHSRKAIDTMTDLISLFEFKTITRRLNKAKTKGHESSLLLSVLMILPFTNQASIYALLKSGFKCLSDSGKDSYYRLKNNATINWRRVLWLFAGRYRKLIVGDKEATVSSQETTCLIIDDSTLQKTGRRIENIGKVWDHVTQRYLLGFKMLCMGWYDGKTFIPLEFSLHREKGKNKKTPYGLTVRQRKEQYHKQRNESDASTDRIKEMDEKKTDVALKMIRRAVHNKFVPDYVLMDSWFSSIKLFKAIRKMKNHAIHIVAMMKIGTTKYSVDGKLYSAKGLLTKYKSTKKRCRKLSAYYIQVDVIYKDIPLRLFFSRYSKRGNWHLVATTDLSLSFIKTLEIYQIRWTIEVFFKEAKQYLSLGKCQSNDLDAQFADITITMMQYILISLRKRFDAYQTKGELFRACKEEVLEVTLQERLWALFLELIKTVAILFNIDTEEIFNRIFNDQHYYDSFAKLLKLKPNSIGNVA